MTMSWVADMKPSSTANSAIAVRLDDPAAGSVLAMPTMAATTPSWASSR